MAIANTDVLTALSRVQHPTLGRDLVSLGVVKALAIDGGDVRFTLALPEAAQAVQDNVVRMANEAVAALDGAGAVAITVEEGAAPGAGGAPQPGGHGHQQRPNLVPEVKHVIAVGAGKGGVGKSTVAVNLAVALAKQGASVGLMDADVYGPSVPTMLGLTDWVPVGTGERLTPPEAHGVKFISIGFFLEHPDQPVIWRGPMIDRYVKQFLGAVEWGPLDYLIVDLPPGTGDVQLSLAQSVPITGSVVVCTPQDVALLDARKAVNMFRKLNAPVLGMVENMSGFVCGHCNEVTDVFGSGGAVKAAGEMEVPSLGALPLDPRVVVGGDAGTPAVAQLAPGDAVYDAFEALAKNLAGAIAEGGETPELKITR
ncbi:MAG: Mrp/NBP35 family ATP-binding protein [Planctomycetota bacterium]|jgi:ATP-binding protein involved in chromosome partitioning